MGIILHEQSTLNTRLRKRTPAGDYDATFKVVDQLVRELMDDLIELQGVSAADAAKIPAGIGAPCSVFCVILGTGVGGGLVYQGQPLSGVSGICGEWGHNTLPLAA